jgi:hypothetical protein
MGVRGQCVKKTPSFGHKSMKENEISTGSDDRSPTTPTPTTPARSDRYAAWRDPITGRFLRGRPGPPPECHATPRCGARTPHGPCTAHARWSDISQRYTRCRWHGGRSTGPRSPEKRKKIKEMYDDIARPHAEALRIIEGLAVSLGVRLKYDGQPPQAETTSCNTPPQEPH